jgi:hypothetical protein
MQLVSYFFIHLQLSVFTICVSKILHSSIRFTSQFVPFASSDGVQACRDAILQSCEMVHNKWLPLEENNVHHNRVNNVFVSFITKV